jgi:hypothetical protein
VTFIKIRSHRRKFSNSDSVEQKRIFFYEKYGLRGVIGAIDGTLVNITAPPSTDEDHPPHVYIDRLRLRQCVLSIFL